MILNSSDTELFSNLSSAQYFFLNCFFLFFKNILSGLTLQCGWWSVYFWWVFLSLHLLFSLVDFLVSSTFVFEHLNNNHNNFYRTFLWLFQFCYVNSQSLEFFSLITHIESLRFKLNYSFNLFPTNLIHVLYNITRVFSVFHDVF